MLAAGIFLPINLVQALIAENSVTAATVISAVLGGIASFLYCGMVIPAVPGMHRGGADLTPGEMTRTVAPFAGALLTAGLVYIVATLAGFALFIVPGLILATIWIAVPPVIVLEGRDLGLAFARSRELVRGNGLRVFATILIIGIIVIVAGIAISLVGTLIGGTAGTFIGSWLASIVTAPPLALAITVIYLELGGRGQPAQSVEEADPKP